MLPNTMNIQLMIVIDGGRDRIRAILTHADLSPEEDHGSRERQGRETTTTAIKPPLVILWSSNCRHLDSRPRALLVCPRLGVRDCGFQPLPACFQQPELRLHAISFDRQLASSRLAQFFRFCRADAGKRTLDVFRF